eukprot:scaffold55696_cov72-Phaeocystis_antarctica.AAC.1
MATHASLLGVHHSKAMLPWDHAPGPPWAPECATHGSGKIPTIHAHHVQSSERARAAPTPA